MGSGSVRIGPTPVSWPKVVKGVPNQGVDCSVIRAVFSVSLLCLGCMWCYVSLFLVVSTSAIDCLERLVSEMTCYVSSRMLNQGGKNVGFTNVFSFFTFLGYSLRRPNTKVRPQNT